MAAKEEALDEFLKSFRICLNFILLYSSQHKTFIKSVAELKEKTARLLAFMDPIDIIFTPAALSIEGVLYSKMNLHKELAALFHQRKVQGLKISRGITEEELTILMEKLALSPKEIIRSGGLSVILSGRPDIRNFTVVDLDYSQFLRGEGEEVMDVWASMIGSAAARENSAKVREFVDNFEVMIQKLKARALIENDELRENLQKFLEYLKKTDREKFLNCSRSILKMILKDKSILMDDEKARKLKVFLDALSVEDYSQTLWDSITGDENFDVASFQLFSKLLEEDDHKKVADSLAANFSGDNGRKIPAHVSRKIKELFSTSAGAPLVSEIYRRAIMSIGDSAAIFSEEFVFDRKQLLSNYRYILLNLLIEEKNAHRLEVILERLLKEWDKIVEDNDPGYMKNLGGVLSGKKAGKFSSPAFDEFCLKFYSFIEAFIWEDGVSPVFSELFEYIPESSLGRDVYLKKMFDEGRINPRILKAFFRFFPYNLQDFYARLQNKRADIEVVSRMLDALKAIDSPLISSVMETIYGFSGDMIRIEILRFMAKSGNYNRQFIFDVIRGGTIFLKKEALAVLTDQRDNQMAMEIMFFMDNSWGKNNRVLAENLGIVEELRYKQAVQYLEYLERNTAFWNFGLKKRIKQAIGRLNGGTD